MKKDMRCSLAALLAVAAVPGCAPSPSAPPAVVESWVEGTLRQMTLDEKVGQVLCPAVSAAVADQGADALADVRTNVQTYHVGSYIIYGYPGRSPASVASLISTMQGYAKVPLLITADLEGGAGHQFEGATRFPRAMAIGATGDPQYAYDAGDFTGREGRAMGVNVNFYPVVDVNNNPENPIINIRSFGESPARVAELGAAYVRGAQTAGIIATAKHFPGHGDTSIDSHLQLPVLDFDRARLDAVELPPFIAAIQAGVKAVMTAHITLPQIDPVAGLPASLSPAITTSLLRNELGFKELVVTDALTMQAITQNFGSDQAPIMAIKAGADIALIPADIPEAFAAVKSAVQSGEIPRTQLDAAVRRLLNAKAWAGLDVRRTPDLGQIGNRVGTAAARAKAQEIIEHALTLVKDDRNSIPLALSPDEEVLLLNFLDSGGGDLTDDSGRAFQSEFVTRHLRTLYLEVTPGTTASEAEAILHQSQAYGTVVVSCFLRLAAYRGSLSLSDVQQNLLRALALRSGALVFVLFGSPYLLNFIPELPSYALAYEFYPGAEAAMVRAIFGEIPFQGRLPVTVGSFPAGFGLEKPGVWAVERQ